MPSIEWYYDASTSRTLRVISHLLPAALGGALLLFAGTAVIFVITNPSVLLSPMVLFFALLLLVGGPASLFYLWPMLADRDQRPSAAEFEGDGELPFTAKSQLTAAVSGAIGFLGLTVLGVPFDAVYWLVVGCVFSPITVAALTTNGRLEEGTLTINRTEIPLSRVENVRSVSVRGFVVAWISYARRSGVFLPRLVVVPAADSKPVLAALRGGIDAEPEIEPPDPAVRGVLFGGGTLFFALAALVFVTVPEQSIRRSGVAALGGAGSILWLLGWYGV